MLEIFFLIYRHCILWCLLITLIYTYFICIFLLCSPKKIYKGKRASVEAFKRGHCSINFFLTLGTCISKTTNITVIIFCRLLQYIM